MKAAEIRSIPRGPPQKKGAQFTQGALRTPQFAPRGHGYYDAFAQTPDSAVVSATTGPATVICGFSSDTIVGETTSTGDVTVASLLGGTMVTPHTGNATLIVFNPGSCDQVVGHIYKLVPNSSGAFNVSTQDIRVSQFEDLGPTRTNATHDAQHHDGDPNTQNFDPTRRIESIPLRGSLRIRNVTEALSVGGTVRALRYNGGVNMNADSASNNVDDPSGAPSPAMFMRLAAMVRDSPRTKVYNGEELRHGHQANTYPADFVRSMSFEVDRGFQDAVARPAYCNLIILIDDFAASTNQKNNTYEVNVMVQRAARFGMGTLLGGMARNLQVRPIHHHASAEQSKDPLVLTR